MKEVEKLLNITDITLQMIELINKSENNITNGTDKKLYVLSKLKEVLGDKYNEALLSSMIDVFVAISNQEIVLKNFKKMKFCCIKDKKTTHI